MPEQHTWIGASGTRYQYWVYPADQEFDAVPGNYVFAARANDQWFAIYAGQTKNLSTRFESHHRRQCIDRRAPYIHVRRNDAGEQARRYEEGDIIQRHQPPCNG